MEMAATSPLSKKRKSEEWDTPESVDTRSSVPPPAAEAPDFIPLGAGGEESQIQEPPLAAAGEGEDGVDHISGLPDTVLGEIISLLPTKDGARTQILASRWRHLWRSAPLNLDSGGLPDDDEALAGVVSGILSAHWGPGRRFRVSALHIHRRAATVDAWLRSPALYNLEELDLGHYQEYGPMRLRPPLPQPQPPPPLPASTFRFSSSLRVATVGHCHLSDDIVQTLQFPLLKMLALQSVSISEGSLQILIASCPGLECMLLDRSYGFRCVRINSAGLRCIGVRSYHGHGVASLQEVLIEDAPCLEKFLYLEWRMSLLVSVIAAPKLETVGCISDFSDRFKLMLGSTIIQAKREGFYIISSTTLACTIKTLAANIFDLNLDVILGLLKCFPFLEKLYIQWYQVSGKNLWRRKYHDLIKCLNIRLKTIVFNNYRGIKSEANFANFFVLNAKMLESMIFQGRPSNESKWFLEDQHRLLQLEKRASRHARFYFTSDRCHHDFLHINHAHDLSVDDPFECTKIRKGVCISLD